MKSKFILIYEDIMNQIINVTDSSISFKFNIDNNVITSTFNDLTDDGNVITIKAKYDGKKTNFMVKEQEKNSIFMDEKQFMMKYYKLYKAYKNALKKFKKENDNDKLIDNQVINDNTTNIIPKIQSFNEILHNIDAIPKTEGTQINSNNSIFTFKKIDDDKYKNMAVAYFTLMNPNAEDEELIKYNAVAFIKMNNKNSVMTQLQLNDPKDNTTIKSITESEFKEKYLKIYQDFKDALQKFEKEFNQNNINI